jgi:hypothetical protein
MKTALDKIITVSGKGGLFKVISGGKTVVIAESIVDGQRTPLSFVFSTVRLCKTRARSFRET